MKLRNKYQSIIIFSFLFILFSCSNKKKAEQGGEIKPTGKIIMETGELVAINSKAFILPRFGYWNEMRIIGLSEHGAIVHPGDSIIQLDPTEVKKYIVERETNLETQLATVEKLRVDQDNMINELMSNYKTAQATYDLKKISLEAARFESERYKQIKQLEFEQEKISLARDAKMIELNKIVNYNDMKIQEIRTNQIKSQIKTGYDIIKNLTIRTPYAGVFQIAWNYRTRSLIKIGDNIYAGNNLARVPDLSQMKVTTFINENDFLKIYLGQKVSVRLDAMPNISFEGEVTYIGKLCYFKEEKSRQKVFDIEVTILKSDERLKPGMTVSCEYLDCK
jgi:hypothetical protein